jgi:hypothetical protein
VSAMAGTEARRLDDLRTRASNAVGMARLLPGMLLEPEHAGQPLRKR